MKALCCNCGELRTVSANYFVSFRDPNRPESDGGPRGWRRTGTLKCFACGERTRHAFVSDNYYEERWQRYAFGGEWEGTYPPDQDRLRAEYQRQFPRNPKLNHRFWVSEADKRRAAGETHMPAVCGDVAEIPVTWSTKPPLPDWELRKPERIDWDTEFEDPATGLWWVDMDCVNCLRVVNDLRRDHSGSAWSIS